MESERVTCQRTEENAVSVYGGTLVRYEQTIRLRWVGRREGPVVRPLQPGAKRLSTVALAGPYPSSLFLIQLNLIKGFIGLLIH